MTPAVIIALALTCVALRWQVSRLRARSRRLRRERDETRIERDFYVRACREADAEIADLKEILTNELAGRN